MNRARWSKTVKKYLVLSKPGIIAGNLMIAASMYVFAASGAIDPVRLASLVIGTACIIAASCALNNLLDADIDVSMKRTKLRPTVTGQISAKAVVAYAAALYVVGVAILLFGTNALTAIVGVAGAVLYVGIYTPLKKRSPIATVIGTLPGAIPVLAGFSAATDRIGQTGWLFFTLLACWQMAHFYAIAIYRNKEYTLAGVPTRAATAGVPQTIFDIKLFILFFIGIIIALAFTQSLSPLIYVFLVGFGLYWLWVAQGEQKVQAMWARSVFLASILLLPMISLVIAIDPYLK